MVTTTWPKVILDPVHNLIPFDNTPIDRLLLALINAREFQRLRRIKQLGLSELVFPGSNHSRFAHSIGVMHVARLMLKRIETAIGHDIPEKARMSASAAALLHDIGHGPFSHAFEKVTGENHEQRSLEIVKDPKTEVSQILRATLSELPDLVSLFIEPVTKEVWRTAGIPLYLRSVVSSQLDADRLDYLLRDSFSTGTIYGRFDLNWLLLNLKVDKDEEHICLGRKARSAVETYVFARHHMYKSVYFHKTTRAAEVMLKLAFRRYQQLLRACGGDDAAKERLVRGSPPMIRTAFDQPLTLSGYLELDDFVVTEFLKRAAESPDRTLARLGGGIVHRRLYKARDVSNLKGEPLTVFVERAKAMARDKGFDPDYDVVADSPADTSYKPYNPAKHKQSEPTQIFIEDDEGQLTELASDSEAIHALTKEVSWLRYYVPEELRSSVDDLYQATTKGK